MEDVEVFFVANLNIIDKETYQIYEKGFFPILRKHGGEFITYDDSTEHLEGNNPLRGRVVIFKFPSESAAKTWYNDPEYQKIAEYRKQGAPLVSLTMVKGLPSRI
uniref:DUF1330 domain-containing protein n=1 Tax=uncultured gamma proteobacterium HF0770_40P16 TaxID=723580 RepID=E7C7T0_9GAMM|nr:hypothetical protein [uncultured gamma proteobacterium HF0770_40P16]